MGVLRKIRHRLIRVEKDLKKDLKGIRSDLRKYGEEEKAQKRQALRRLHALENQLQQRHP